MSLYDKMNSVNLNSLDPNFQKFVNRAQLSENNEKPLARIKKTEYFVEYLSLPKSTGKRGWFRKHGVDAKTS